MSNAHNYSFNALPAYQFLGDMQTQYTEKYSLGFYWGALSDSYTFLPRVAYKNVILAKARWRFLKKDFEVLLQTTAADYIQKVNEWRTKWNMPERVVLADTDNTLLINFEDLLSIKMLAGAIKQRDHILLEEFLFDSKDTIVTNGNGDHYTNECIALLLKNEPGQESGRQISAAKNAGNTPVVQRDFAIGSE